MMLAIIKNKNWIDFVIIDTYSGKAFNYAFWAGFIAGYAKGWDWYKAARLGNACGAIVVTKHGCANFMPTYEQVIEFVDQYGGW